MVAQILLLVSFYFSSLVVGKSIKKDINELRCNKKKIKSLYCIKNNILKHNKENMLGKKNCL